MCFDDIPEDAEESYPCPEDCGGNVRRDPDGIWCCDTCDWSAINN